MSNADLDKRKVRTMEADLCLDMMGHRAVQFLSIAIEVPLAMNDRTKLDLLSFVGVNHRQ